MLTRVTNRSWEVRNSWNHNISSGDFKSVDCGREKSCHRGQLYSWFYNDEKEELSNGSPMAIQDESLLLGVVVLEMLNNLGCSLKNLVKAQASRTFPSSYRCVSNFKTNPINTRSQ